MSERYNVEVYAYKKKSPDWLKPKTILDQLPGDDRYKAYRIRVQHYSEEEGSTWEDVKHGLIYGGQDFVSDLKARYLSDKKDVELSQHNSMFREFDADLLIKKL